MKKLFALITIFVFLFGVSLVKNNDIVLFNLPGIEEICVISDNNIDERQISTLSYNYFKTNLIDEAIERCKDKYNGLVLKIKNINLNEIDKLLNLQIINREIINDYSVINAYTSKLAKYVIVSNKKSNLQIAVYKDSILVGYPNIMTGF